MRRLWDYRLPCIWVLASALSAGLFSVSSLPAQQPVRAGGESLRLDLGMGQSPPGAKVVIPATLKVPDAVDVESVDINVTFSKKQVSFVEAKKGISSDAINAEVTSAVKDDSSNPENSVLTVTIRATEKGTSIPNGHVANLTFKIDEKAPLKDMITLKNNSSGTNAKMPGQLLEGMRGTDGEIIVDETALVFSCFFYMH